MDASDRDLLKTILWYQEVSLLKVPNLEIPRRVHLFQPILSHSPRKAI